MMASSPSTLVAFHGEFMVPWMMGCRHREIVLSSSSRFHFNEFEQLGVVNHVALVQEHDGHANLTGQQVSRVWGMGRQRRNTPNRCPSGRR
jgi:hypothetical protein